MPVSERFKVNTNFVQLSKLTRGPDAGRKKKLEIKQKRATKERNEKESLNFAIFFIKAIKFKSCRRI